MKNLDSVEITIRLVLIIFIFSFAISLTAFKLWLIGSLATSSIKAISDDCGIRYGIEKLVSGNWFCPAENK